jgi:hypothetical protein
MSPQEIVKEAVSLLEVETGFVEGVAGEPSAYFAEIPELGLKCFDFTEEAAVSLILQEAEFALSQELSRAKDILAASLK